MPQIPQESQESQEPQIPPPPEFTLKNVLMDIVGFADYFLNDPQAANFYHILVFVVESILYKVIVSRVEFTEIDFSTYIEQVDLVSGGELDYAKIRGESGPIVYPAGFVWIYTLVSTVLKTDGFMFVQKGFGVMLTLTLLLYAVVYGLADSAQYNNGAQMYSKPWIFALLLVSKRLHSIYLLRMFNDCFVALFVVLCILCAQGAVLVKLRGARSALLLLSSVFLSCALSVKMNALLYVPGYLVLLFLFYGGNLGPVCGHVATIAAVQAAVAYKFLFASAEIRMHYLARAYDFSRQFMYKWTINWKFLPEDVFHSRVFHVVLLVGQLAVLGAFFVCKWTNRAKFGELVAKTLRAPFAIKFHANITPRFVFYVLATSNLVGVVFSRSLHYQFLSWYYFSLPFLYCMAGWNPYFMVVFHGIHEYCWLAYPSNTLSSSVLVASLVLLLASVWRTSQFSDLFAKEKSN